MSLLDVYTPKQIQVAKRLRASDWFICVLHGAKRSGKTVLNNDVFLQELVRVRKIANELGIAEPTVIEILPSLEFPVMLINLVPPIS